MKIIIVGTVPSSVFGFRLQLLKELKSRGHQVIFYLGELSDGLKQKAKAELDVECRLYPLSRTGLNPLEDLKTMMFLRREFKREKPDAVFSFFTKPVIWATLAAKLTGVPRRIAMLEGLGYSFTKQPHGFSAKQKLIRQVQLLLYRLALPRTTHMLFLNPDDPKDLLEEYKIRVKNVDILGGIGVDLDKFTVKQANNSAMTFLFIGRLIAVKGMHEFFSAIKIVKQTHTDARFIVLGEFDNENPESLKKEALDELIEQGLIEYPGYVSNVHDWVANSDVFVLPSYREGVPASTQEAMASGKAIITTDAAGCRCTITDGVNGFMIPPGDAEILAEKMIWMIENPERVKEMGLEGRKIAEEKFDAVVQSKKLADWICR